MKKIIAFGTSNSPTSINKTLAAYAANHLKDAEVNLLDLNDFELPLFSVAIENKAGIPDKATEFAAYIQNTDAIIVSVAEHNGMYTSAFKNLWDWLSRYETMMIWRNKPIFLLATSPSRNPELNVFKISKELFPRFGGNIIASFCLPSFHHFFKDNEIIVPELREKFSTQLNEFRQFLNLD